MHLSDTAWPRNCPCGFYAGKRAALLRLVTWRFAPAGEVVALHSPKVQDFDGKTLEEARAWCLVWLMAPELGVGLFVV